MSTPRRSRSPAARPDLGGGAAAALLALAACGLPALPAGSVAAPGDYAGEIEHDGADRSFRVHLPRGHDGSARLPLVIALHGAFDSGAGFEERSGLSRLADRERFIAVYPEGTRMLVPGTQHWNAGHCCGKAMIYRVDDTGFIGRLLEHLLVRLPVDPARVFVLGYSNGGMLAYRVGAAFSSRIAAIGVVAGSMDAHGTLAGPSFSVATPPHPVSLIAIHGTADERVAFEGRVRADRLGLDAPFLQAGRYWAAGAGCTREPSVSRTGAVTVQSYHACARGAEVVLMSIEGWGHGWPDSAATIWRFFADHPRR